MQDGAGKRAGRKVEIGIYLAALLMPGAVGVSSSISTLMEHYGIDQVAALNVVSVPCFATIVITLVSGWLMSRVPKKTLCLAGIVLFLAGGVAPAFLDDWAAVIVCRAVFGLGLGTVQATTAALVAENYEGGERDRVMGSMLSFQMLGLIIFSVVGGQLGALEGVGYHAVFLVHLLSVASFVAVLLLVPRRSPAAVGASKAACSEGGSREGIKVTAGVIIWFVVSIVFYLGGQVYSNVINLLLEEFAIGGPAEAGVSLAIFAFGGFLAGFLFAKVLAVTRRLTLAVGLAVLAASYLIMAFSGNLIGIYAGAFLCGLSFSICVPLIMSSISNAGVNEASAAFAVSLATCGQSIGQSISPYVVTPLGAFAAVATGFTGNQMSLVVGAAICVVFAAASVPYSLRKGA